MLLTYQCHDESVVVSVEFINQTSQCIPVIIIIIIISSSCTVVSCCEVMMQAGAVRWSHVVAAVIVSTEDTVRVQQRLTLTHTHTHTHATAGLSAA